MKVYALCILLGTLGILGSRVVCAEELSLGQSRLADLKGTRTDIALDAKLDRADASYPIGEPLSLSVITNKDVYLTILDVGSSGRVSVVIPNANLRNLPVMAHSTSRIPPADSAFEIRVSGPPGFELMKIIATPEPIDIVKELSSQPAGVFRSLSQPADKIARDLPEILSRQADHGYAVSEIVFRVVDNLSPAR